MPKRVYLAGPTGKAVAYRDVRGVPIAVDRCSYREPKGICIRQRGHSGRHITSKDFRR